MFTVRSLSNFLAFLIKEVLVDILKGLKDSAYGIYGIHVYYNKPKKEISRDVSREPSTRKLRSRDSSTKKEKEFDVRCEVYKCCGYNAVTYFVSVIFFYYIILNLLKFFLDLTLTQTSAKHVWEVTEPSLTWLFSFLWTIPLFLIFKVINAFWFQDIANSAYKQRHGRPQAFSISGIGNQISDVVFSIVIEVFFLIQASLMQYVPYPLLATILTGVHFCLLNSLYAFEYLWCNKGWTFHKRISYIENNWPYFIGFGFPLSLVTFVFPSLIQSGFVYSVFFPLFIISAIEAPPIRRETSGPALKLFTGVVWLSSVMTKKLFSSQKWTNKIRS